MKKYILIFSVIFCSVNCSATSCLNNHEETQKRSAKYRGQVDLNINRTGSAIDVSMSFPLKIDGLEFSHATLLRGNGESSPVDFMVPLLANKKGGKIFSWYMINSELFDRNIVEAIYGQECGIAITYEIK